MLVSIAGSQGSGKTTIIEKLKNKHDYLTVERKTSRSILSDWGVTLQEVNNDEQLTMKFQDEILERKMSDDLEQIAEDEIVITERTPMDLLLFATVNLGKNNTASEWLDQYGRKCIEKCKLYKHVFFLTSGHFDVEKDGVRGHNSFYSSLVDASMLHFYRKYFPSDSLTIIDTPDMNERLYTIQNEIMKTMYPYDLTPNEQLEFNFS